MFTDFYGLNTPINKNQGIFHEEMLQTNESYCPCWLLFKSLPGKQGLGLQSPGGPQFSPSPTNPAGQGPQV